MTASPRTTAAQGPPKITRELASYARSLSFEDLSKEAITVAKHCLLDWLGVTLAGSREPLAQILRTQVADSDSGDEASLLGVDSRRVSALNAALINGATSHALDFDDTHTTMSGHPSVPVVPAALALTERERRSGRDLLVATVTGIELESRVGALLNPAHYQAGFHATGTLGTLGAAAASAWLLEVSEERWPHVLGLAATQAAGLKASFGTMAKPLHAGKAAHDGMLSALLAADGFTGNPDILEVLQGFADTHGVEEMATGALESIEGEFLIRDTLFKYNAACYLTHSAIESASLLHRHFDDPSDIVDIAVLVAPSSLKVCNILEPTTGLEGKFSLRSTTALSLLGDDMSDLATYSDERVVAAEVLALRERIRIEPTKGVSPTRSTVRITLRNGKSAEEAVDVGQPSSDLERQGERLSQKFAALACPVVGKERAAQLEDLVKGLENLSSVEELVTAATVV